MARSEMKGASETTPRLNFATLRNVQSGSCGPYGPTAIDDAEVDFSVGQGNADLVPLDSVAAMAPLFPIVFAMRNLVQAGLIGPAGVYVLWSAEEAFKLGRERV